MILLFLGSWRSTLIVLISIPLSILTSIVILYFMGHTLNTMTLGGMALAVGILVDDSTVTIENTHRLRNAGMSLAAATVHGSAGIAVPTMVSTLAISCVFKSVVFLEGPAKFLFTPLGLAVVFAMLASYGLSRTLTPVIIGLLLKSEHHGIQIKAFVFVATLGHSRQLHVHAFRAEKQEHCFAGLESAFTTFGAVPEEVLMDNPRYRSKLPTFRFCRGTLTFIVQSCPISSGMLGNQGLDSVQLWPWPYSAP